MYRFNRLLGIVTALLLLLPLPVFAENGSDAMPYLSEDSYVVYSLTVSDVIPLSTDVVYPGVLKDLYDVNEGLVDRRFRLTYVVEDIGVDSMVIRYEIESLSPDMEVLDILAGRFTVDRRGHYIVLPWGRMPFLTFVDIFKAEDLARGEYAIYMERFNASIVDIEVSDVGTINHLDWYYRAFEFTIFMEVLVSYPELNVTIDLSPMFTCSFDAVSGVAYRCMSFLPELIERDLFVRVGLSLLDTNLPLSELPILSFEGLLFMFTRTQRALSLVNPLLGLLFGLLPLALIMLLIYVVVRIVRRLRG